MSSRNCASFGGILLACGLACVVISGQVVVGQESTSTSEAPEVNSRVLAFLQPVEFADDDSELVKKLKERQNAAVELLKTHVQEYRSGVRDVSAVLEAARFVTESKLDLASDNQARLAVYQERLELAKMIEDRLGALYEAGIGSVSGYRRAQVDRMNIEVEILKLKQAMSESAGSAPAQP